MSGDEAGDVRPALDFGTTPRITLRYAPEGSIVIGAETYARIRGEAVVRALGAPESKGKTQAVQVYELLGLRDAVSSAGVRP